MIHDPLISISVDDLRAVLASRRARGLSQAYPRSVPEIGRLTFAGRLWWIAESVQLSRLSHSYGRQSDAQTWQERAQVVAEAVAAEFAAHGRTRELRAIADALEGKQEAPVKSAFSPKQSKMNTALVIYRMRHGMRFPSATEFSNFVNGLETKLKFTPSEASKFLNHFPHKRTELKRGTKAGRLILSSGPPKQFQ